MPHRMTPRAVEIIGRNVVAIREQCDALLCLLADIQDVADKRGGDSEGRHAAAQCDDTAPFERADRAAEQAEAQPGNPDAPAGAPAPPVGTNRVLNRGDIRTTPSGERVIRPTFGKPQGEPLPVKQSTDEDTTQ